MKKTYDYIIVGAGFFGSVIAERIASQSNYSVLVIDRRDHIGGNCYSETDGETGIEYHKYGPHIFHTSSRRVWDYIRSFTEFNAYFHKVLSHYRGKIYSLPVNLSLINAFFNTTFSPAEAQEFMAAKRKRKKQIRNFEDLALASVGQELYEAFYRDYTLKQWGIHPKELPADTFSRIPIRFSYHDSYYDDMWCGIPREGYTRIFERMLSGRNIDLLLGVNYREIRDRVAFRRTLVYSGPIDGYFGYSEGRLSYRTVDHTHEIYEVADYQGNSIMNYPELCYEYTRIIEPKHFHPEKRHRDITLVQREVPRADSDGRNPLYPVNTLRDKEKLASYKKLAKKEKNVIFGGRLGAYRYFDMDEVIESALNTFGTKIRKEH